MLGGKRDVWLQGREGLDWEAKETTTPGGIGEYEAAQRMDGPADHQIVGLGKCFIN